MMVFLTRARVFGVVVIAADLPATREGMPVRRTRRSARFLQCHAE